MTTPSYHVLGKEEQPLQAVMALFSGEKASQISAEYHIGRSDLYKFRNRALAAMREALKDHPGGPKRPHNRLSD
jgi:Helix-turn-helix domain